LNGAIFVQLRLFYFAFCVCVVFLLLSISTSSANWAWQLKHRVRFDFHVSYAYRPNTTEKKGISTETLNSVIYVKEGTEISCTVRIISLHTLLLPGIWLGCFLDDRKIKAPKADDANLSSRAPLFPLSWPELGPHLFSREKTGSIIKMN